MLNGRTDRYDAKHDPMAQEPKTMEVGLTLPVTTAEIHAWLDKHELGYFSDAFLARNWVGGRLLLLQMADFDEINLPHSKRSVLLAEIGTLSKGQFVATGEALTRSLQLADRLREAPGVENILREWPAPIAHELWVLIEQLSEGKVPGAVWQLRDVAEVLCKVPAVVMLRDYLENGASDTMKTELRRTLIGAHPPSFGQWSTIGVDRLPKLLIEESASDFVLPELAGLFRDSDGKVTLLAQWLSAMVRWRNEVLGHGAFDADDCSLIAKIETQVPSLLDALTPVMTDQPWSDTMLAVAEPANVVLRGWNSIRQYHQCTPTQARRVEPLPVLLTRRDRSPLALDPYLAVRRCLFCSRQEVFLFNSRNARKNGCDEFFFLDYATSHSTLSAWWNDPAAVAEAKQTFIVDDGLPPASGFRSARMEELLEQKALEADYVSPVYLRNPLRDFLKNVDHGIYWLRAPAHVGKTQFVRGLAGSLATPKSGSGLEVPILPNCGVIAFYIRREHQSKPEQLIEALYEEFARAFDLAREDRFRLHPSVDFNDHQNARLLFSNWLNELVEEVRVRSATRLLICLDGVDELPVTAAGRMSLLELLPNRNTMAKGLYILLTSRPKADCPPSLWSSAVRLLSSADVQRDITLGNRDYRSLLIKYFDSRSVALLRGRAAMLFRQSELDKKPAGGAPDPRLAANPWLRHELQQAWEAIAKSYPEIPASASPDESVRARIVDWFEQLRDEVLERADHRFLYVSFLVERLRDDYDLLSPDTVPSLPKGDKLLDDFDTYLRVRLPGKLYEWSRRIVLLLAAAEEVDFWERREVPLSYMAPEFRGVAFDELLELLGLPPGESDPAGTLLFAVYALKATLSTWKGEEAKWTRYRLGLKGLTAAARSQWPNDLDDVHRGIVSRCLEQGSNALQSLMLPDEAEGLPWRLLGHAESSGSSDLVEQILGAERLIEALWRAADGLMQRHRLRAYVHAISVMAAIFRRQQTTAARIRLISAYTNRAIARHLFGDIAGAIEDTNLAVELADAVPADQTVDRRAIENALSAALAARANARSVAGELSRSLDDYSRSLELRRNILSDGPGANQLDIYAGLASTFVNRGTAYFEAGEFQQSSDDLDRALQAMETLVEIGRPEALLTPRDELAYAHACRSEVRRQTGRMQEALADVEMALKLLGSGDEGELKHAPVPKVDGAASAHIYRSSIRTSLDDLQGALEDTETAVRLREDLRTRLGLEFNTELMSGLAGAYEARGGLRQKTGDLVGARADYDTGKKIMEEVIARLRPNLPAPVAYQTVKLLNNGAAISGDAIRDYSRAIALLEELQKRLRKDTPPHLLADIAAALSNRGLARHQIAKFEESLADFRRAIELGDGMVRLAGEKALPDWIDNLAVAHMRLGIVLQQQDDLARAIGSYATAIKIMEDLHRRGSVEWRPCYATDLASMYNNSGVGLSLAGDFARAIEHLSNAITAREKLCLSAAAESLRVLQHDLAASYLNRARARLESGDWRASVADTERALHLLDGLQAVLGADWPASWSSDLAFAHMYRAAAYRSGKDFLASLSDAEEAIRLWEELKAKHQELWQDSWTIELAISYFGRALARDFQGDQLGALEDYSRSITLGEELQSSNRWLPSWSGHLADFYLNRGALNESVGDLPAAADDATRAIAAADELRGHLRGSRPTLWGWRKYSGYNNRANALEKSGDIAGAIRDRKRLAELVEQLGAMST
jgi:tetratricopeptide (TPR) repeat protein